MPQKFVLRRLAEAPLGALNTEGTQNKLETSDHVANVTLSTQQRQALYTARSLDHQLSCKIIYKMHLHCHNELCLRNFDSLSAALQHLESGQCLAGVSQQYMRSPLHMACILDYISSSYFTSHKWLMLQAPEEYKAILCRKYWRTKSNCVCSYGHDHLPCHGEIASVSGKLSITCLFCKWAGNPRHFSARAALEHHLNSVHHREGYVCPICEDSRRGKRARGLVGFVQHLESHAAMRVELAAIALRKILDYLETFILQMQMEGSLSHWQSDTRWDSYPNF
jgi:hypothetical protein